MRDPCEEGHQHAKRHATCTTDKRGVSFDAQLMYYGGMEVWFIKWLSATLNDWLVRTSTTFVSPTTEIPCRFSFE